MDIKFGNGKPKYGPGIQIVLSGEEVARAVYTYLAAHNIHIDGQATITVNGGLCKTGGVYVDPSGKVVANGKGWSGKGWSGRGLHYYIYDKYIFLIIIIKI